MTRLEVVVPRGLWMSANRVVAHHGQRQRVVRGLHRLAAAAARQAGVGRLAEPCTVTWEIRYPPGTSRADPPNAYPVTKALLDGLVGEGLLSDDHAGVVVAQAFFRGPNTGERGVHLVGVTVSAWGEGRS